MTKCEKKRKKKKNELVSFFFCSHFCASFEMMLHGTIRNDNFRHKTALQCWNSVSFSLSIFLTAWFIYFLTTDVRSFVTPKMQSAVIVV